VPSLFVAVFSIGGVRGEIGMMREGLPCDKQIIKNDGQDSEIGERLTGMKESINAMEMTRLTRK
jgi:hypothetical protein